MFGLNSVNAASKLFPLLVSFVTDATFAVKIPLYANVSEEFENVKLSKTAKIKD